MLSHDKAELLFKYAFYIESIVDEANIICGFVDMVERNYYHEYQHLDERYVIIDIVNHILDENNKFSANLLLILLENQANWNMLSKVSQLLDDCDVGLMRVLEDVGVF